MAMTPPSVGLADLPYSTPYAERRAQNRPSEARYQTSYPSRRVEISALRADGSDTLTQTQIPAHPIFESAFSAFGRGTMIATPDGEVAIEDLLPGDMVLTGTGASVPVDWIGSCVFASSDKARHPRLVRVMSDTFGMSRPHSFLTLGQGARVLQTPLALRGQMGPTSLLTQVTSFVDNDAVIPLTPPTPVHLFHIMLREHATIRASGLDCETFHPGQAALRSFPRGLRQMFFDLFPLIRDAEDFGPLAHRRAPDEDIDDALHD